MDIKQGEPKYIIVIGASAGGLNSILELTAQIPEHIDAALFIVMHFRKLSSDSHILNRIQNNTSLHCHLVENEAIIRKGHIYIAIPDKHMVLKRGKIVLGHGPQ